MTVNDVYKKELCILFNYVNDDNIYFIFFFLLNTSGACVKLGEGDQPKIYNSIKN